MFEKQKATSVTGTQRTKGRLEAFEGSNHPGFGWVLTAF